MNSEELIVQISKPDFDLAYFNNAILTDRTLREAVVTQMINHPHIMVYYNCFYTVERACQETPELFYPHWAEFAALLGHKNSYHRNFGLTLVGLLTRVDKDHHLDDLLTVYLACASDKKFLTAHYCVHNCIEIISARPELSDRILSSLLDQDAASPYTGSQASLLKADILDLMEQVFADRLPDVNTANWIIAASNCQSPKSRNKAKQLMRKLNLQ